MSLPWLDCELQNTSTTLATRTKVSGTRRHGRPRKDEQAMSKRTRSKRKRCRPTTVSGICQTGSIERHSSMYPRRPQTTGEDGPVRKKRITSSMWLRIAWVGIMPQKDTDGRG